MGNQNQAGDTAKSGSGRDQQHGKPPTDGPIADDAGRFTREPAEGGRENEETKDAAPVDAPVDGGARGKSIRNH